MFSVELKFTVDCLKFWFEKILELDTDYKQDFINNNFLTPEALCCICDFRINSRAKNGWADHAFKVEYLFLEKIYTKKQMTKMEIQDFEVYEQKLNKILDKFESFCESLENENNKGESDEVEEIINR